MKCPQRNSNLTKIRDKEDRLWYSCPSCKAQFPVQSSLREVKRKEETKC